MPGFVLTGKAQADVLAIGRYTAATWGREQRNQYLALLDRSFHELAANPFMGQDCAAIRTGYRKHLVGRHLVFYRSLADGRIEVVRILHERMDVEHRLSEPNAE